MKKLSVMVMSLLLTGTLSAQEYKLAKSSGKLIINEVNRIAIEGYSGNEIVFTSMDGSRDKDSRAAGLRAVSGSGLEDNTGIGLSVVDKGTTYEVYQLKKMDGPRVKIMVPKGVSIEYNHTSPHGSDVNIRNVEGEVDASTVHSGVHLENVTGPVRIKTVHGEIEADFPNPKNAISLTSNHGFVDVSFPQTIKANLNMGTNFGEIFVDPAFKIEIEPKSDWVKYGSNKVSGKLNGGGLEVRLGSDHGNVYVRKK